MAALDFPASPTNGQVYEGSNGVIYTYVGTAPNGHWSAFAELSSESFADIFVEVKGDNMTGDLTLGTDKITLNADGTATIGAGDSFGDLNVNLTQNRSGLSLKQQTGITPQFISAYSQSNLRLFDVNGNGSVSIGPDLQNGDETISLNADGSGVFGAGDVSIIKANFAAEFAPQSSSALTRSVLNVDSRNLGNEFEAGYILQAKATDGTNRGARIFVNGDSHLYLNGTTSTALADQTLAISSTRDVLIGGTLPSAPNISLNADGTAGFQGDITAGDFPTGEGSRIRPGGSIQIRRDTDTQAIMTGYSGGTLASNVTYQVLANGSVTIGTNILSTPNISLDSTDGSITADGDIQSTSQNGGQLAGFRNQIINGDFRVWQRGVDTSDFTFAEGVPPTDRFIADRWYQNQDTAASTARRVGPGGNLPPGYGYALLMSTFDQLCQGIELPDNGVPGPYYIGSTWTVSYWCNTAGSISTEAPSVRFRQTSTGAGGANVTTSPFGAAIETVVVGTETWRRFSSTFTVDASPTASHDQLRIGFSNGAAGGRITGVQLEPGPVATPFEHRPIGTELALCQRYYLKAPYDGSGRVGGTSRNFMIFKDMRAIPTVTNDAGSCRFFDGTNALQTETVAANTVTPSSTLDYSINAVRLAIASTNLGTSSTNLPCGIYIPKVTLDAEL